LSDEVQAEIQLFVGKKFGIFKDEIVKEINILETQFAVMENKFTNLRLMILAGLGIIEGTVFFLLKINA
jgi:hypothetical protein